MPFAMPTPLTTLASAPSPDGPFTAQVGEALARWPAEILALSSLAVFGGLVLWIAGARLVRPIFALLGLLAGSLAGYLIAPSIGPDRVAGFAISTVGLVGGALSGLVIAALLYRLAVAGAAAVALGAAGLLGTAVLVSIHPDPAASPPPSQPRTVLLLPGVTIKGEAPTRTDRARQTASLLGAEVRGQVERRTLREKAILATGLVVPAALGLSAGLFAPKRTAALISAPLGAALWLIGGAGLLHAAGVDPGRFVGSTPTGWAIAWGAVSAAGLAVQMLMLRKKKDAPKQAERSQAE